LIDNTPSDWEDETEDDDDDMDYEPAVEDQFEGLQALWADTDEEVLMRLADASEDLSGVEIEFEILGGEDDEDDDDEDGDDETATVLGGTREFGELTCFLFLAVAFGVADRFSDSRSAYEIAGQPWTSPVTGYTWRLTVLSPRGRCR
jgi:hypothetical protein